MRRIICIGNRLIAEDAAGPLVYERLARAERPPDVELIDGGLAGLDLLRFVEHAERVVFVDAVQGHAHGRVVVLRAEDVREHAPEAYGHAAGLAYLLRAVEHAGGDPRPEVWVVGIAGRPDTETIETAASLCLGLAAGRARAVDRPVAAARGVRT